MTPFSIERMVLRRPEMPAAGSECPMLLLTYFPLSDLRTANRDVCSLTDRANYERSIGSTTGSENRSDSTHFRGISSLRINGRLVNTLPF